tara:strand:- start:107 stop:703 length:597 start_codon:yes stop_codon:yes gene_type:complete
MKEKEWKINNFVGIYDNYISEEDCKKAIKLFDEHEKFQMVFDRQQTDKTLKIKKQDKAMFAQESNMEVWLGDLENLMDNFNTAFDHYVTETSARELYDDKFFYTKIKIQKTLPTQGYHIWHIEHGKGFFMEPRAFVYTIYLNDVEAGGETEFLHQSVRVKPVTGRIVIWPAGFPYVHRGNPPLSGEKYILTSWMNVRG